MDELDVLVKDLYAKYAPNEYSDDKLQYVKDNYSSGEEFAKDFYAKFAPSEYSEEKMQYIRDNYSASPVEKKNPNGSSTPSDGKSYSGEGVFPNEAELSDRKSVV